jgi:hypothetical protein
VPETSTPCVLVVADPGRVAELTDALSGEPLPQGAIEVVSSTGGDDTIELFAAKKPRVVVLTATLEEGDPASLIEVLRGMVPRDQMVMVLVGDDENGPVKNALDAVDLKPDRFVSRPLAPKALRFAVGSGLDNVARALGELPPSPEDAGSLRIPENEEDRMTQPIGSRTTTPLRGSGPTAALGSTGSGPSEARAQSPTVATSSLSRAQSPAEVAAGHVRASSSADGDSNGAAKDGANGGKDGAKDSANGGASHATKISTGGAGDVAAGHAATSRSATGDPTDREIVAVDTDASASAHDDARRRADSSYDEDDDARYRANPRYDDDDADPYGDDADGYDTREYDDLDPDTDTSAIVGDDDDAPVSDGELPFVRRGTAPRFSSPVDMGEVPTVMSRTGTRTMQPVSQSGLPRAPTDRGTGVPPLAGGPIMDNSAASVLTDRLPRASTEKGTGIDMVLPATPDEALALDPQARRAAMRARWEALADSIDQLDDDSDSDTSAGVYEDSASEPVATERGGDWAAVARAAAAESSSGEHVAAAASAGVQASARAAGEADDEPAEPLPPVETEKRKKGSTNPDFLPVRPVAPWRPGTTAEIRPAAVVEPEIIAPPREPTLIIPDDVPARVTPPVDAAPAMPMAARPTQGNDTTQSGNPNTNANLATQATESQYGRDQEDGPTAERGPHDIRAPRERWSHPVLLSELIDRTRDSSRELLANVGGDDLGDIDSIDDDIIVGHPVHTPPPHVMRRGKLEALEDFAGVDGSGEGSPFDREPSAPAAPAEPPTRPSDDKLGARDFARQLRAKMSMMAQRLFQSDSAASQSSVDVRPRHDHHTEIDLAALGEEQPLVAVTEIERAVAEPVQITTSPGTWDTQVRERGLPDSGEIVRGVSDVSMILARMFALNFTGRVGFRKDEVEKVIYFDGGRPVFASSNEPGDRMGQLLVREGKITASQYERCQVVVAQSGRRMGEILVDFGYLKRRELLPAVRRHVEDIIYSLFGWDRGHYHVTPEQNASAERIRLSRHPASLVIEGIRRKLDRTTLEKLLGTASTVIEVPDRDRLGSAINTGDLGQEERAALAAFDGQADLAQVARTTGADVADVLPLAWGLCVLGLATARRAEIEHEESTALVGETDLAIDRERVRSRWQLVTEADYFALLGVRRDATGFEIRRAYQSARRDFAPDGFPTDLRRELARELEEIAVVLDEAFRVLRDDRLRQTYLANLIE